MGKKLKYFDNRWAIGNGINRSMDRENSIDSWIDGEVITPDGIVVVYSQGGERNVNYTRLEFVIDGYCYSRAIEKRYSKRGLAKLAKQYAREMTGYKEGGVILFWNRNGKRR